MPLAGAVPMNSHPIRAGGIDQVGGGFDDVEPVGDARGADLFRGAGQAHDSGEAGGGLLPTILKVWLEWSGPAIVRNCV